MTPASIHASLMSTNPLGQPVSPKPDVWWPLWVHRVDSTLVCDWVLVDQSVARRPMKSKDFLPSIYGGITHLLVKTNKLQCRTWQSNVEFKIESRPGEAATRYPNNGYCNIASFAMGGRASNVMDGTNYSG